MIEGSKNESCAVCHYCRDGTCKRYPPLLWSLSNECFVQPTVKGYVWCGEFKRMALTQIAQTRGQSSA